MFTYWNGEGGGKAATEGCKGSKHKTFAALKEAADFLVEAWMPDKDTTIYSDDGVMPYNNTGTRPVANNSEDGRERKREVIDCRIS